MALCVAASLLVFRNIGLLEVCSRAHQQQANRVRIRRAPIELRRGARPFTEVVEFDWFRRIQVAARSESIGKEVVAELPCIAAVVRVYVIVVESGAAEAHTSVAVEVLA